ncbi:hypothetical protein T10_12210 [Trichinella papuae]|uniref:Uncharacterized protein n=1 Tax=Trichinella papuae TaxID=268474 RepID=A0A0V1MFA0_9BILA|nr:hypothetical protein T10_12210 [Trichinella papuae]
MKLRMGLEKNHCKTCSLFLRSSCARHGQLKAAGLSIFFLTSACRSSTTSCTNLPNMLSSDFRREDKAEPLLTIFNNSIAYQLLIKVIH